MTEYIEDLRIAALTKRVKELEDERNHLMGIINGMRVEIVDLQRRIIDMTGGEFRGGEGEWRRM